VVDEKIFSAGLSCSDGQLSLFLDHIGIMAHEAGYILSIDKPDIHYSVVSGASS